MVTSKRLSQVAQTVVILPFLLAALLGLSLRATPATHTTITASYSHTVADVDDPPPSN